LLKRNVLGEPAEFTLKEINRASGKIAAGMIAAYEFDDERFQKWQAEIARRVPLIERKRSVRK